MMLGAAFQEASDNLRNLATGGYLEPVQRAIDLLVDRFRNGGKLLVFGNGGSAADAQHICAELVGRFLKDRRGLPAVALTDDAAILTAWANDRGFEGVFARQVEALGAPGDVAWGISTSGRSPNILCGLETARRLGLHTIGLTGARGGGMAPLCDVLIAAPVISTPRIQEIHLVTYHVICDQVEKALFPAPTGSPR